MNNQVSFALVGLFVLVFGSAAIGLTLWLGFAGEAGQRTYYVTHFSESVSGLDVKAPVKFRGVAVGRVSAITLDDPSRVRVLLEVEVGTPITADTVATLSSQGLTGIAHIELGGGHSGAPLPGGSAQNPAEITTGPSLFVRLDSAVSSLLDEMKGTSTHLNTIAVRINDLLASNNVETADQILKNVQVLTQNLAEHARALSTAIENINRASGEAASIGAELPALISQVRGAVKSFDSMAVSIANVAGKLDSLAVDARRDIRSVAENTLPEVSEVLTEVRKLAQTLNRLGQELERDPSLIIRGRSGQQLGPGE